MDLLFKSLRFMPDETESLDSLQVFHDSHHTPEGWPVLYRCLGSMRGSDWNQCSYIWFAAYKVLDYTPQGVWIDMGVQKRKFVNLTCERKFAHMNKQDALYSFIRRKQMQLHKLASQTADAEANLGHAEAIMKAHKEKQ